MEWIRASLIMKEADALYSAARAAGGVCKLIQSGGQLSAELSLRHLKTVQGTYWAAIANEKGDTVVLGALSPAGATCYEGHFKTRDLPMTENIAVAVLCEEYGVKRLALMGTKGIREGSKLFRSLTEKPRVKEEILQAPPAPVIEETVEESFPEEPVKEASLPPEEPKIEPENFCPPLCAEDVRLLLEQAVPTEEQLKHSPRVAALEERIRRSRWINPEGNHITGILFDEENNPEYVLYGIPAGHLSLPPLAEEPFCAACEEAAPSLSYYEENEVEIGKVFDKGIPETVLETAIPDSRWVRVEEECGACYVMGIIREREKPLYICYGVPSHYTQEPPQGMAEYCQWLPANAALPKEEGYWMMYQDAITGRTVAP